MPSQADLVADGINRPALAAAFGVIALGFLLVLTFALMPLGLILMAVGALWVVGIYATAMVKAKLDRTDHFHSMR